MRSPLLPPPPPPPSVVQAKRVAAPDGEMTQRHPAPPRALIFYSYDIFVSLAHAHVIILRDALICNNRILYIFLAYTPAISTSKSMEN